MADPCTKIQAAAGAGHIVAMAIQGAYGLSVGYNKLGSPYATLQETWKKLHDIKDYLDAVSPERKLKIEAAAKAERCKSLMDLEDQFQDLWDGHTALIQEYEASSLIKRHLSGGIRGRVSNLEAEVKALLNDTRTTTRAHQLDLLPPPPPPKDRRNNETNAPTDLDAQHSLQNTGSAGEAMVIEMTGISR